MTPFDVLEMIGGLCLFLFGMNIMGQALERRAGGKLRSLLGKLTSKKSTGFLTGLGVTAVVQSSSAITVMVVGFVNSGLMTLKQAINVIMGANIGTTVTAWILSLGGIDGDNFFVQMLKPTSFTPILALLGVALYMFCKGDKRNDTGLILLGFATLMFGMDTMSGAVAGLSQVPEFTQLFVLFQNPILGVIVGAVLTAIIQSSSASVGILQALAVTGAVTNGAAIPIIMGQNIGTCVTAIISSIGANKNAKRAACVHLSFNIIGTVILLTAFMILKLLLPIDLFLNASASQFTIAVSHTVFNVLCTVILLPMSGVLEKIAYKFVPDTDTPDVVTQLDERLLATPPLALRSCQELANTMAMCASKTIKNGLLSLQNYSEELAEETRKYENETDKYEDALGSYLIKLSSHQVSEHDSSETTKLLRIIGDLERISDHGVNLLESAEEIREKSMEFSTTAVNELKVLISATEEILSLTMTAFMENDIESAHLVEPLEEVIDRLRTKLRNRHVDRLQKGGCTIEAGFVWSDLLTNIERTADHCSNIAGCVIDMAQDNMNLHESLREMRENDEEYKKRYQEYKQKYAIA